MRQNFNLIAPFYDSLARMLIGGAIIDSQLFYLDKIPPYSKVLIVGGGTGWILNEVLDKCHKPKIWYIESSLSMMKRSRKACRHPDRVNFLEGDFLDLKLDQYDVVITFYFLDVFTEEELVRIITALDRYLKDDGMWLYADFRNSNKLSHKILIRLMIYFFRFTTFLKARQLVDHARIIEQKGFMRMNQKAFKNGMIHSIVFKRPAAG